MRLWKSLRCKFVLRKLRVWQLLLQQFLLWQRLRRLLHMRPVGMLWTGWLRLLGLRQRVRFWLRSGVWAELRVGMRRNQRTTRNEAEARARRRIHAAPIPHLR